MRGIAALAAAAGVWLVVGARLPHLPGAPRLQLPRARTVVTGIAVGAITAMLALGTLGVPAAALSVGVLAGFAPVAVAGARRTRDREALAGAWPDFLALLRGHLAGGSSLPEAFHQAAVRSGTVLAAAAADAERVQPVGAPFHEVLSALQRDLEDPTADRVLSTIAAAHRSGGRRVSETLTVLGESVAEELRLRRAHHAALTEQRLTALVALLAPWVLFAMTVATNPQAADAYRSAGGMTVIAGGMAATGLGYLLARRTARLSRPPRVMS